jgi:hypothetical protein
VKLQIKKFNAKRRLQIIILLILSLILSTNFVFPDKVQALQSDLTASLEPAGLMVAPTDFTDTTVENFDNRSNTVSSTNVGTFSTIAANTQVTAQSGGTSASPTNTTYTVCGTVTDAFNANFYGGAGGSGKGFAVGTNGSCSDRVGGVSLALANVSGVTPATNVYRYIGFWWSAGNAPNIVRLIRSGTVEAVFTTTNLLNQLGSAPASPVADYFGNPSSGQNSDTTTSNGWNEPYAFIHLRLPTGFDTVQFIGTGFELDNVTLRQNVPASTSSEVAIVGSGVVGSCANLADTNAQYVLRNGSFEDNYITAANGSTNATLASVTTSDTTSDIAKWVRYGGPYQFSNFYDADSGLANRIPFWMTSASDGKIELQRQVSGSESSASNNGASYWDLYGPRPAEGSVHAEINANSQAALFQDIRTIGGEKITWTIKHRGRFFGSGNSTSITSTTSDSKDKFEILVGPASGTLSAQTPARKRLPNVVWNTSDAAYGNNAWTNFTTNTTSHTAQTMYTRLEDGWVLYTGTYTVPANQTTTRFSFSARGDSTATIGNLIDDIGFDPIIACPRTLTIQQNVSATYDFTPLTNSQIPGYTYPETTNVTSVSINGGSGTATLNTSNNTLSLSSNTIGSFQVLYTLTDINSQTSTSTITVNVENATGQNPTIIPVDPRKNSIKLPELPVSGAANAMICVRQVSNSSGTALSGSPTLSVTRSSATSGVTFNTATNLWNFFGTAAAVQTQTSSIDISGLNSNPLVTTSSKFIEVGYTAATAYGTSACFTGTNRIIELKPLDLDKSDQFTVTLD